MLMIQRLATVRATAGLLPLPFFLEHNPFEPQLKIEIVYQDYYP